jgi:3-hydroxy acid dehydrogenase/malonic semialdehyde reductase
MKNRTIFITGATSGIVLACARQLHAQGAKIIAAGRRTERLKALQDELGAERLHILTLDLRDAEEVARAFTPLPEAFAAIDALINSAGLALGLKPAPEAALEDWQRMVETNILGLLYCTQAVLPGMKTRGRGHIINLGSVAGVYPYPGGNVYGATKAFVAQFSLNLRADLLGSPIRVSVIEPGMAETEFSEVRFQGDQKKAKEVYRGMQPLRPEDIADAICYCLNAPPHVNVNRLELMPVQQAFSPFAVAREEK